MSKIYLLRDNLDINNGFYTNGMFVEPDEDYLKEFGHYRVEVSYSFISNKDILLKKGSVC